VRIRLSEKADTPYCGLLKTRLNNNLLALAVLVVLLISLQVISLLI
jgi:hypothetical protein